MDTTGDRLFQPYHDGDGNELLDEDVDEDGLDGVQAKDGSDDASTDYSTDEETTILLRPEPERKSILTEFEELVAAVPQLGTEYELLDRLGTGTFSSVYKARDLLHDQYDNSPWKTPSYMPEELSKGVHERKDDLVAVKRIYVTSSPERIKNEIQILADVIGCRHVCQLISAFRVRDQVVAVMPYHRNDDFRTFYDDLPLGSWQDYFRCLFRALRDIHARNVIHRDVKPANFLFDVRTGHGTLVDFGLAQIAQTDGSNTCNHSSTSEECPNGAFVRLDAGWKQMLLDSRNDMRARRKWPSERVGWPADEKGRHASRANRAGTRGFRAPEVLFKCNDQSGAIDVWAAGTILLFFLTKRFPIYTAGDDVEALMELATIIGHKRLEKAALLHNRSFITNVPDINEEGMGWRELVLKLNPTLLDDHEDERETVNEALDLLDKCLEPEATRRITARDALYHDFLRTGAVGVEEGEDAGMYYDAGEEDDTTFVHPPGRGACASLHRKDEVTGQWHALVGAKVWKSLAPGEGLCIGWHACPLHTGNALPPYEWDPCREY
ncbi:kinase-like protein [Auriculariales sp. MPI-PUGE-AT-0066]|nr:kinase-like protein [Auriculariales sp. MPI-PUGE-AT-0066]